MIYMLLYPNEILLIYIFGVIIGEMIMKMITQENIRKGEFLAYISLLFAKVIFNNKIPSYLSYCSYYTLILDFLLNNYTERLTQEHKEMKVLYGEIVKNTTEFYNDIGMIEPVSIFATYIYMYRLGLFSHNKKFRSSSDMKDFVNLNGIDVIRGKGVCRSISSMLTDIYKEMNFDSRNLSVRVAKNLVGTKLNPISLFSDTIEIKDDEMKPVVNEMNFDKFISNIICDSELLLKLLPFHQINLVQHNNYNYILDPTNDYFLVNINNKLMLSDNGYMTIANFSSVFRKIIGHTNDYNYFTDKKKLSMDTISREEYKRLYLNAIDFCLKNEILFEEFFSNNVNLINDIYKISEEQHSLIKRKLPFFPLK